MDILGYTILVLILIAGLPLLLFALRRGKNNVDKAPDESEWYDENGNHIYYDRKLIRYLTQTHHTHRQSMRIWQCQERHR